MKSIMGVLFVLLALGIQAQSYDGDKPKSWVDMIGEKYSGKDKDLSGFKIVTPEVVCDYLTRKCAVIWNHSTERSSPTHEELKSYTMYFEVFDRKNNKIISRSYKWDRDVLKAKDGYVGRYDIVARWGEVDLKYSTVNYWVQDIKWAPKVVKKQESDGRKAFTVKEQLENMKKNNIWQ